MKKNIFILFIILGIISLFIFEKYFFKHKTNQKPLSIKEKLNDNTDNIQPEANNSFESDIEYNILEKTKNKPLKISLSSKKNTLSPMKETLPAKKIFLFGENFKKMILIEKKIQKNSPFKQEDKIEINPFYKNLENNNVQFTDPLKDIIVKPFKKNIEKILIENNDITKNKQNLPSQENISNVKNSDPFKSSLLNDTNFLYQSKPFYLLKNIVRNLKENKKNFQNEEIKLNQDLQLKPKTYKNSKRKLSEIIVKNNKYTKSFSLKKKIKIKPNDYINEKTLQEHLNFINLNPFRKVQMFLVPKEQNYCDIELICDDKFFFRPYIGTDNTGLKIIDRDRIYAGFDWNNPFTLDSILSYQFLSSYNFNKFQAHTGHWTFFLPWENILTLFSSYAYIEVDHMIPYIVKHNGSSLQTSIRYNICLPILSLLTHNFILGFDFKRTDTNLIFSRFSAIDDTFVNLTQFLLSYTLNWDNNFYNAKALLELYFSPGPMVCDQENSRYNNLRRFAKNKYVYAKGYFSNLLTLPKDFLLFLMLTGQMSNANLLPSETFSLGGYNTIRGYYEREVNTDSGIIINLELRSPSLSLIRKKNINDSLRFIAFFDYGYGSIHETLPFEEKNSSLIGFGPGIRYVINTYLAAKLDWGIKAKNKQEYGKAKSLLHFSVNLSY